MAEKLALAFLFLAIVAVIVVVGVLIGIIVGGRIQRLQAPRPTPSDDPAPAGPARAAHEEDDQP